MDGHIEVVGEYECMYATSVDSPFFAQITELVGVHESMYTFLCK